MAVKVAKKFSHSSILPYKGSSNVPVCDVQKLSSATMLPEIRQTTVSVEFEKISRARRRQGLHSTVKLSQCGDSLAKEPANELEVPLMATKQR